MIEICPPHLCVGCSACFNICAHDAIQMKPDKEGFLQPEIDQGKCTDCKICTKKCPVLHPLKPTIKNQAVYAMISHKDRKISSSGGAFSIFARWTLSQGGVVYGAGMDNNMQVKHIQIENLEDLNLLRGSKYVQSEIGNTYNQAKIHLQNKRRVLFVGTPCQIAGLYNYLGKPFEDLLITLDLVCHGVPSQLAFDSYLKKIQAFPTLNKDIKEFRFRKLDSWSIIPAIRSAKSKWHLLDLPDNAYMEAFFRGLTFRECCFHCEYCNTQRVGTFTIADFWGIGKYGLSFKKNIASGVSLVIDNKNRMPIMKHQIKEDAYIELRTLDEAVKKQHNLRTPVVRTLLRNTAVHDLIDEDMSLKEFSQKYGLPWKKNLKFYLTKGFKRLIHALKLYNLYKTIAYKLK